MSCNVLILVDIVCVGLNHYFAFRGLLCSLNSHFFVNDCKCMFVSHYNQYNYKCQILSVVSPQKINNIPTLKKQITGFLLSPGLQ